jgi:S-formylglutathione hydrolase FrmB
MVCGTEDGLLYCNRSLRDTLIDKGFNVTYKEAPGDHNWEFWDAEIQPVLEWMTGK